MALIPAPREVDSRLKDWWVENPWMITTQGKSLSGYERNRVFLNGEGRTFHEISGVTGADSDGDGRSVVAVDFTGDGMEDLMVRQAGGGPVLLFENRFPKANWLRLSLRGVKSNRLGIGAKVIAEAGGQKLVRELYPHNGFKSQGACAIHLGLGEKTQVDKLTIRWPSGEVQILSNLAANRSLRITEGEEAIEVFGQAAR